MKRELEVRRFPMQLRLTGSDDEPTLEGHIAVFNQLSDDLGGFREKIAPGAFKESIAVHDIRALWNHDHDLVLGRNKADTLELKEDDVGLAFKNRPPLTTWFRDRLLSLKRGDVTGCSFGFFTDADEWGMAPDGTRVRTLLKVTLVEVSPGVTFPAYPQTDVAVRSMQAWIASQAPAPGSGQPDAAVVQMESRNRQLQLQRHDL
jgi:HK97 family phage prohead protease